AYKKNAESDEDYKVNLKDLKEKQRVVCGIHDVYGGLFDKLGYAHILKNPARHKATVKMFRDIVLGRIANPQSKRSTVGMLEEDFGITLDLDRVYKMMDSLDDAAIDRLNDITYKNTAGLFNEKIDVIFFDCTTIYFETFEEDSLRRNGYSKDLKFNQPQVLLAMMVTKEGLPIGYQVFEGDVYEGHTVINALKAIKEKRRLGKVVFVADAGMFNKENLIQLDELEEEKIEYIVGARIKNMPKDLQEKILDKKNYKEISKGFTVGEFEYKGRKVIVSYRQKRADKDAYDRDKAIQRLRKKLEKQRNAKAYLSNYGNKKYLKIEGKSSIELDEGKIKKAAKWDGLKGVVSNAQDTTNPEILEQYNNLWNVENAFRITKHDLKVRPVFHWKPQRVKSHLAISFAAYALVKHLEYRVKLQYKKLSPQVIRETLIRVQTSILYDKRKRIRYGLPSRISKYAQKIYQLLKINHRLTPYIIKKM
ncbi:MAG: IS1634 family transposase, partial [Candidatus Pacebacteria bacterium]|nr:IS1634 family transposase [Candidatus Paceibacterota bacterium]